MIKRKKWATVAIFGIVIVLCTISFLWAPNDPNKVDLVSRLLAPNAQFPFGTDTMGRCVLSRVLYGAQTTLGMVILSALLVIIIASPIGMLMGYFNGEKSWIGNSLLNTLTAFPQLAYLIVFIGAWGNGIFSMLTALTIAFSIKLIKLIMAKTEVEKQKAYVLCAVASGASHLRIMAIHIFPNIVKEAIVFLGLACAEMILMITSFSFIGLGLGTDVIDWGGMILEAGDVSILRPDLIFYPILFVFIATFAFNKLGEQLE